MRSLIILEDEPILRAELATYLRAQGFAVDEASSIANFRACFDPARHMVALLDLGLPDGDGMSLITELRAVGEKLGIVVLTARNTGRSKIEGLLTGADHFFHKPVDLEELTATLLALMRRLESGGVTPRWTLDTLQCQLLPPGKQPIRLTAQGYIVLKAIVAGKGQPVSRRKIVEALGQNYLQYDLRRLDTQMHELRKLVEEASGLDLPVRAVRGVGYQATAEFHIK